MNISRFFTGFGWKAPIFAAAMLVAVCCPASQQEGPRGVGVGEQIGSTRGPDRMQSREDALDGDTDDSIPDEAKRHIKRVANGFKKRFLDQWKRFDEVQKQIRDEMDKDKNERNMKKVREWRRERNKIVEENQELWKKYDMISEAVHKETQKQIKEEKIKEAQEEENKKAKQEGRKPKEIDDVDMPHGSPPILH